jgi:flagellar basal-body rod modification protein FlgD
MDVTPVNNSIAGLDQNDSTTRRLPTKTLGQEDFLKLLVTQLTTQDPLNPLKDTEFIAQMTQFSALEQFRNMQTEIAKLRSEQQISQAQALLGRTVELQIGLDAPVQGTVQEIEIQAGTPKIVVNNQAYELSQVLSVKTAGNTILN